MPPPSCTGGAAPAAPNAEPLHPAEATRESAHWSLLERLARVGFELGRGAVHVLRVLQEVLEIRELLVATELRRHLVRHVEAEAALRDSLRSRTCDRVWIHARVHVLV